MGHFRQKKPGGNWYYTFYYDGRKHERSLRTKDKKLAKQRAAKIDVAIAEGTLNILTGQEAKRAKVLLGNFINEYREKFLDANPKQLSKGSITQYRKHTKYLLDIFSPNVALKSIRPEDVERLVFPTSADNSPETTRSKLITFHAILKTAVEWGYLKKNPFSGKIPKKKKTLPVMMKNEEVRRIIEYFNRPDIPRHHCNFFLLCLYTGMRPGEVLNLQWKHIFFDQPPIPPTGS